MARPGCVGLEYTKTDGITFTPLLSTDTTGCWNRIVSTDFVRDSVRYTPETGDQAGTFTTTLALTREVNGQEQRVLIAGNTDFLSNGEFAMGRREVRNFNGMLKHAAFYWLSHEELPVNTSGAEPYRSEIVYQRGCHGSLVYRVHDRDTCSPCSCRDHYMGASPRPLIFKSLFYEYDI